MTIEQRIIKALGNKEVSYEDDTLDKLIGMAYHYGAETTAKKICNKHNQLGADAIARAEKSRYWKQAKTIIGDAGKPIYDINYAGDMISIFGRDETNL